MTGLLSDLLLQTAEVYRRQESPADSGEDKKDRFGQPERSELPHHTFPCRVTRPAGGHRGGERMRDVVEVKHELFADLDCDLRERDVVKVINPDGSVYVEKALTDLVRQVLDGMGGHHVEAMLVVQRAAS